MNNYTKAAIWILAAITIAAAIAFARVATWSAGVVLFIGAALVLTVWLSAKHHVRTTADMIIYADITTTISEINRIITTLSRTVGDYEPDKYRIQRLRQIRLQLRNSDMPTDTTPANP